MECYSAIIKNEILPFATMWMDLANIMLSEISQTVKDKYSMSSLLCRIQKVMNTCAKQKQTHRYRKQSCGNQRGEERREGQIRGMR